MLATDLSSRSDRAQDRAVSLAKLHDCELIVLHVLETPNENNSVRRIPFLPFLDYNKGAIEKARRKLLVDMTGVNVKATVLIEKGEPHEVIMDVADDMNCGLIVTGVARNETLGRYRLGKTVDRLIRKSGISLLVVSERFRGSYGRIAVAADLSPASKDALETAVSYFPDQAPALVYAFTAPRSSAVDNIDDYREQMRQVAHRDLTNFIAAVDLTAEQRARISMIIEYGNEAKVLKDFIRFSDAELVVMGSPPQGLLSYVFFGGHARRFVSSVSCDALVVRSRHS